MKKREIPYISSMPLLSDELGVVASGITKGGRTRVEIRTGVNITKLPLVEITRRV